MIAAYVIKSFAVGGAAFVFTSLIVRADAVYYLGGVMGIVIIIILNATVAKIYSLYMTLILFAGQVFAGAAVDVILTHTFSPANLIGGVLVTLGLSVNVLVDWRIKKSSRDDMRQGIFFNDHPSTRPRGVAGERKFLAAELQGIIFPLSFKSVWTFKIND